MYAKTENGYLVKFPYSLTELYSQNPNVSFPSHPSDDILNSYGVYRVVETKPRPQFNRYTQKLKTTGFITFIDSKYIEIEYVVVSLEENEIQQIRSNLESDIREKRNRLLLETDWSQLQDAPVDKEKYATYRQQLRDITNQTDFPYTVEWPTI